MRRAASKKLSSKAKNRERFARVMLGRKTVAICLGILAAGLIIAVFAPLIAPYDPYQQDL